MRQECWVLLDDCNATADAPTSRLFSGHVDILECADAAGLEDWMAQIRQALERVGHSGWLTIEGGNLSNEQHNERLDLIIAGK